MAFVKVFPPLKIGIIFLCVSFIVLTVPLTFDVLGNLKGKFLRTFFFARRFKHDSYLLAACFTEKWFHMRS